MKTEHNTTYDKQQKQVETVVSLGSAKERFGERIGERILHIATRKNSRGELCTSATVYWHGEGMRQHAMSVCGDKNGDYSRTIRATPCARATEKAIMQAHDIALADFGAVVDAATNHYK